MGYLLKEALKALCGVNQWAYAVFWKIGCQNPNLLIWEECYYESASCSGLPEAGFRSGGDGLNLPSGVRAVDKVHSLVNRMMADNHFHLVGEGLVGRVAFTGNCHWILSGNYCGEEHSPEVLKEVCQQFAAGMQTIAVIPALPHGVVQFGSFSTIMENPGFVKNVMSLVLELGYVSGALLSEDFAAEEHGTKIRAPVCPGNSNPPGGFSFKSNAINPPSSFDSFIHVRNSSQSSTANSLASFSSVMETQTGLQSSTPFNIPNSTPSNISLPQQCHNEAKIPTLAKLDLPASTQMMNAVAKAEVIPSNPEMWMKQHASACIQRSSEPSNSSLHVEQKVFPNAGSLNHFNTQVPARIKMPNTSKAVLGTDSFRDVKCAAHGNVAPKHQTSGMSMESYISDYVDHLAGNSLVGYSSLGGRRPHRGNTFVFAQGEPNVCKKEMHHNTTQACDFPFSQYNEHISSGGFDYGLVEGDNKTTSGDHFSTIDNSRIDGSYAQPESGDDLFDVLGADFKNQLFSRLQNDGSSNESSPSKSLVSEMYCTSQGNSDAGIFSSAGTDNLLDAVVTKVHPTKDNNVSCRTTLTSTSGTSVPNKSLTYGSFGASDQTKGELLGLPKYPAKAGATSSCSLITKEESGAYSQGSSIYGSQISSWIQKNEKLKPDNSVSTGYSKKPETSKPTRRRLKPGENPRPRPKDRQMIQDRVKELREIVPNGAKCSIDSLLERTIKHMLFLQSVAKHADKLKQTGESKIISKDGGLLLKDDFEGGATWAYEVGSQSLICPIIVEDLNQPRQMLVEMLCEERGLFLEIADIIRGLGLTILKGVMETRDDKIWARFAVEANRDVTRMEIFISLVRLLEQSSKTQQTGISNENPMVAHQSHQQGMSIPVVANGSDHLLR